VGRWKTQHSTSPSLRFGIIREVAVPGNLQTSDVSHQGGVFTGTSANLSQIEWEMLTDRAQKSGY